MTMESPAAVAGPFQAVIPESRGLSPTHMSGLTLQYMPTTSKVGSAQSKRGAQAPKVSKVGRPGPAIVTANFRTELCKNFATPQGCKYGSKCAFAHSIGDLRRMSLTEMEQAGRIPNASKFRVFPCLTFLSTGACPYRDRCVFIHDPRVKGDFDAYLYATPGSNNSKGGVRASPLFWPDMPVQKTQSSCQVLWTASVPYEVTPRNPTKPTYFEDSVGCMWNSFCAVMAGLSELGTDDPTTELYSPTAVNPLHARRLPLFLSLTHTHTTTRPRTPDDPPARLSSPTSSIHSLESCSTDMELASMDSLSPVGSCVPSTTVSPIPLIAAPSVVSPTAFNLTNELFSDLYKGAHGAGDVKLSCSNSSLDGSSSSSSSSSSDGGTLTTSSTSCFTRYTPAATNMHLNRRPFAQNDVWSTVMA